jgi:hypothetical protein
LRDSVDFLRENDRDKTEGLFRIPGDSDHVNKLIMLYDSLENNEKDKADEESDGDEPDQTENLLEKYSKETSPHDVATLMKRYLMKLASPLIDENTKKDMIAICARGINDGKDKQLIAYEVVIRALDIAEENRICLAFILRFLLMVSASATLVQLNDSSETNASGGNKMTVENLARVFAPIIMRDDDTVASPATSSQQVAIDPQKQMKQIDQIIAVTEILIWNALELVSSSSSSSASAMQSGSFSSKSERF